MKFRTQTLTRAILATGVVAAFSLSQMAVADVATDDLEITAGLTEALTLSCDTALSFGITRLGTLARTNETTIAVAAADGAITLAGVDTGVTTGTGSAGVCTIAGSMAASSASVTVEIDEVAVTSATATLGADANAFSGLDAPGTALALVVDNFTLNPATPLIDANGAGTFNIGATLTIPGTVIEGNLGGYSDTVNISVDDGFDG